MNKAAIATKLYQINGIIGEKETSNIAELQDLKKRYEESTSSCMQKTD